MVFAHEGQIGPWKLLERLGKGGGGEVYSGRKTDGSGKTIRAAIKIVYFENIRDPRVESLQFEHELLKKLRSPYIPKAFDSGFETQDTDTFYWIAFEEVKGDDLRKEVEKDGVLTRNELLNLMHDVLKGLEAAHQVGIIHRDIKPENLIRNSRKTIILDFGGGSYLNKDDVGDNYKAVSIGWAAPENLDYTFNARNFPASLDLFQAAAVFVYAGTKKQPWPTPTYLRDAYKLDDTQRAFAYKKYADEVLRRQAPNFHDLPDDIVKFLKPMLHPDPNKRGTATQALHKLSFLMPEGNGRTVFSPENVAPFSPPTPSTPNVAPARQPALGPSTRGVYRPLTNSELAERNRNASGGSAQQQTSKIPASARARQIAGKKKPMNVTWIALVAVLFILSAISRLLNPVSQISMPDFTGQQDSVAYSNIGDLNASDVMQDGNDGNSNSTDNYFVCAQNPSPGTKISSDAEVTFIVAPSSGDCQVNTGRMPNLVGMELDLASNLAEAMGSGSPSKTDATSDARTILLDSNWQVCSQSPAQDADLNSDTEVKLYAVKTDENCPG